MQHLVLYCRAGFEGECAAEIQERAAAVGIAGYARAERGTAYVVFVTYEPDGARALAGRLPIASLIFARQLFPTWLLEDLPTEDRIGPLLERLGDVRLGEVFVETADTNEAKELLGFCRKFEKPLIAALKKKGLLASGRADLPRLHAFFVDGRRVFLGIADPAMTSAWFMGIPRLRFPRGAPSRAALKLEEAFHTFLGEARERELAPGMRAVDLGAAPGGWSWLLVTRSVRVIAVDNGPMDPALMESGLVEQRREDGFSFRPQKPVDWLVCDMVEQPARIAALIAQWIANGTCRSAIFNLKLPMKRRYQEVQRCAAIIHERLEDAGAYHLAFKQLYHDREEVTGFLRRTR